jgi:xanthine dehydrogenase YagT iron-sulfur-binding subunit
MGQEDRDKDVTAPLGVSRRGFITSVGTGAIGAAAAATLVSAAPVAAPPDEVVKPGDVSTIALVVNGRRHKLLVESRWSLLHVLRDRLGLTGTKVGCERGECGACTVLINGQARYACMTLAVEADGREITTIEGLMKGEDLGTTQQAFAEEDGFQCGYCTPGQVMAAEALLKINPAPTLEEIRQGMAGNICRCGAYAHIFKSVAKAADLKRQGR